MKTVLIGGTYNPLNNAATEYNVFSGFDAAWGTTENQYTQVIPASGTIYGLKIVLSAAPTTNPYTFTVMVNGSPSEVTCDVAVGSTTGSYTGTGVAVVPGDRVTIRSSYSAAPGNTPYAYWSTIFEGTDSTHSIILGNNYRSTATTYYTGIQSSERGSALGTTEAFGQRQRFPTGGTLSDLYAWISVSDTDPLYFDIYKNGAQALRATVTAQACTPSTGSASVAENDYAQMRIIEGGNVAACYCGWGVVFVPTTAGEFVFLSSTVDDPAVNEHFSIEGIRAALLWQSSEDQYAAGSNAMRLKKILAAVSTAPGAGTSRTYTVRERGVGDTALTVTIAGTSTTGSYATDVDLSNYQPLIWKVTAVSGTPAAAGGHQLSVVGVVVGGNQYYQSCTGDSVSLTESLRRFTGKLRTENISISDLRYLYDTKKPLTENVTLTDAAVKIVKLFFRTISDTITMTQQALTFAKTFRRTLSDTINLSHVVTKVVSKIRSENMTLTGIITKRKSFSRSESITLSDVLTRVKTARKTLSDTINITPDIVRRTTNKLRTETINITDVLRRFAQRRMPSHTITLSDTISRAKMFARSFSDTITLTPDIVRRLMMKRRSESISLGDSIRKSASKVRSDAISLTDTLLRLTRKTRSENITLTEGVMRRTLYKRITNSITLTEVFSKAASLKKTFSESVTLSDTVSRLKAYMRFISETITLTESAVKRFPKIVKTQTISLTDVLRRYLNKKALSETITLTHQAVDIRKMFYRLIQETINLTDVLRRLPKKLILNTITLAESLRKAVVKAAIIHTITITAQTITGTVYKRFLSETITLSDKLLRLIQKRISDTINLAESLSKQSILNMVLTEIINITDWVEAILNPLIEKVFIEMITLADSRVIMPMKKLADTINVTDVFRVLFKVIGYRLAQFVRAYNMASFIREKYEAVFGAIRRRYK